MGERFAAFRVLDSDIDTLANSLKEGVLSTAEAVLGTQRKKVQPWVSKEFPDLCDQRWQLKQQKSTRTEARLEYRKSEQKGQEEDESSKERMG